MRDAESLDEIVSEAIERCKANGPVHNLFIQRRFSIRLAETPAPSYIEQRARQWQAREKPDELHINHGMYIHRSGDGIAYLINELRKKGDSNRALLSLISMGDIIRSEDAPVPSFLILQFGLVGSIVYCTAYFRALEVSTFLPTNLAEICLILRRIKEEFLQIDSVELTIHAFRGYFAEDFDCLAISSLDRQERGRVAACLQNGEVDEIRAWLNEKMNESSVILTDGIDEMYHFLASAAGEVRRRYSDQFIEQIRLAKEQLANLKRLRTRTSHGREIQEVTAQFRAHIKKALAHLTT